ncbi:MAG: hypothetical protein ACRD3D_09295 [Terriglobia bacterium]
MRAFGIVAWSLLLAGSLCLPQAHGSNNGNAAEIVKGFVQGFYNWYVPGALKTQETPAWSVALKYKRSTLSPTLFRALKEDSDAQAKASGEIVGLDFDPFLNTQDPCDRYEVGAVTPQKAGFQADIYGVCSGKRNEKPDVVAEVARQQDGSWAFTDFVYPAIHRDLRGTLAALREQRQKSSR